MYIYILDVFVFVYIGIIDRIHRDIYIYMAVEPPNMAVDILGDCKL